MISTFLIQFYRAINERQIRYCVANHGIRISLLYFQSFAYEWFKELYRRLGAYIIQKCGLPGIVKMHREANLSENDEFFIKNKFNRSDVTNMASDIDSDFCYRNWFVHTISWIFTHTHTQKKIRVIGTSKQNLSQLRWPRLHRKKKNKSANGDIFKKKIFIHRALLKHM